MQLTAHGIPSNLGISVRKLLQGTLSPLCGINQEIGFFARSLEDPKVVTVGVDITGIHHLLQRPDPGKGGYHVGGMGVFRNEALIKALGESAERYSQLISHFAIQGRYPTAFCSYSELASRKETLISKDFLDLFTAEQLNRPGFIFDRFTPDKPISWLQIRSITDGQLYWIPHQLLLVGYNVQRQKQEPWLSAAVTTGTAVHIDQPRAIRSALLELIQIDSAMGHWYGNSSALEIQFDQRTIFLERLLKKHSSPRGVEPRFYWLPNCDLLGAVVACVLHQPNKTPRIVVGLGSDTNLAEAMYKSYLEAVGILALARLGLLREKYQNSTKNVLNEENMFDLDSNVNFYAKGGGFERIQQKFLLAKKTKASDLPLDLPGDATDQVKQLVAPFTETQKSLFFVDLTSCELKELNLSSARLWTPELLSLCLPSAVPSHHPRFRKYGGVTHADPHPYP